MEKIQRRYFIVIVLLAVAIFATRSFTESGGAKRYEVPLGEFPLVLGEWQGEKLPIVEEDKVYEILGTKNIISRSYVNNEGKWVGMTIVFSEKNRGSFHPPEICFTASGNTVTDKGSRRIVVEADYASHLKANTFIGTTSQGDIVNMYWFITGKRLTDNYYVRQLYTIVNAMLGKRSEAAMVRLYTPIYEGDLEAAFSRMDDLAKLIVPILPEYLVRQEIADN